jgi:hypothetical protein
MNINSVMSNPELSYLIRMFEQPRPEPEEFVYYDRVASEIRLTGSVGKEYLIDKLNQVLASDFERQRALIGALIDYDGQDLREEKLTKSEVNEIRHHLFTALESPSHLVAAAALSALTLHRVRGATAHARRFLRHEQWGMRERALKYIASINGKRAFKTIITALEDPEDLVKDTAIELLATLNNPSAIRFIEPFLQSENQTLRETAQQAIETIKDESIPVPKSCGCDSLDKRRSD